MGKIEAGRVVKVVGGNGVQGRYRRLLGTKGRNPEVKKWGRRW